MTSLVATETTLGGRGRSLPSGRGRAGRTWSVAPLRARPRWEGLGGLYPSLTLGVWLGVLTASRSYRGYPRWRPRARTGDILADGLSVVPGISPL